MNLRALVLAVMCGMAGPAFAADEPPLLDPIWPVRDRTTLPQPFISDNERAYGLDQARVVLADYDLIRSDFPFTKDWSTADIDAWLLRHAVMAEGQANKPDGLFNTRMPGAAVGEARRTINALRPKDYNRALVVPTSADGPAIEGPYLMDIKGAGSMDPRAEWKDGDPRNGNTALGEAIREFIMEKLLRATLAHSGSGFETVGVYAVIDSGFDVIHRSPPANPSRHPLSDAEIAALPRQGQDAAGQILRQGQTRFVDQSAGADDTKNGRYFLWPESVAKDVEIILRRYGITSTGREGGRLPGEKEGGINIQGSMVIADGKAHPGRRIGDPGNFVVTGRFNYEAGGIPHFYGQKPLLGGPGQPLPQPDPAVALDPRIYGSPEGAKSVDSKTDLVARYSYETAKAVRQHFEAGNHLEARRAALNHYRNMVGTQLERLSANDASLSCEFTTMLGAAAF